MVTIWGAEVPVSKLGGLTGRLSRLPGLASRESHSWGVRGGGVLSPGQIQSGRLPEIWYTSHCCPWGSSEPLLASWSRQECRFPCVVWKGFPAFPAHKNIFTCWFLLHLLFLLSYTITTHNIIWKNTEKAMAPHSSTLAWKIPWTEEPDRLQSMGSQRVGHDWVTSLIHSSGEGKLGAALSHCRAKETSSRRVSRT